MRAKISERRIRRVGGATAASRSLCAFAALVLLFCVVLSCLYGCGTSVVHSDTGKDESDLMVRLGVYSSVLGSDVNAEITRFDAALALEKLLGAGNENRMADYFRSLSFSQTVDLMTDPNGKQADAGDKVSGYAAYGMCLKALGYAAVSSGNYGENAVYDLASSAGFGASGGLLKAKKLKVGEFAVILSELTVLKPEGRSEAVYRVAADLDPDFFELLKNNGLYDDVPENYCPRFNAGRYVPGSFSYAAYDDRKEWTASYVTDEEGLALYKAALADAGWTLEGQYSSETEPGTVIMLYYKTTDLSSDGEAGIVLKYGANGLLSWNLLA
jgi:hypothetical protein